jgi:hypothetical protein
MLLLPLDKIQHDSWQRWIIPQYPAKMRQTRANRPTNLLLSLPFIIEQGEEVGNTVQNFVR